MQIFARITKVDEATGKVYGRAVQEVVDRSGEIFDYESSKPNFAAWSEGVAKVTDGKSVGNVRAMHGKVAAGKLSEITFVDAEKAIDVCAEIVDPVEREKCLKGVYTGFSIGGRYGKKWPDDVNKGVQRYTAEPTEISLVDMPCVPTAQFTVIKSDGAEELRKFEATTEPDALAKWYESQPDEVREELAKIAARKDVNPKAGEDKYGDVKFADEKNHKYPIDTPAHIRAAWNYINKAKNAAKYSGMDLRSIKAKIVAAWKDKIDKNGPPSAAKDDAEKAEGLAIADSRAAGLMAKLDKAEPLLRTVRAAYGMEPMAKSLYDVATLASLLDSLACVASCAQIEADWEGDHSAVPEELRGTVKELAGILIDMADEEVEELVAGYEKADGGELQKVATPEEEEAMNAELQKAHDETKAELAKAAGELAKANESLTKITEERDALKAERDELNKGMEEIKSELEKISKQPAPAKGAARVVEKSLAGEVPDAEVDDKPVMKADGSVDNIATAQKLAKLAYRQPVSR